jgi:hypothetical protein
MPEVSTSALNQAPPKPSTGPVPVCPLLHRSTRGTRALGLRHTRAVGWMALLNACLALLTLGCGGGGSSPRAATQLSGIVAEIDTATPVVGAQVTVDGTMRGTTTSIHGSFFLSTVELNRGWQTIRAQKQIGGEAWTGERAVFFETDIPIQNNLLITIGPASQKGSLRGRVTAAGGAALEGVSVFLNPGTNVAAAYRITDSNGRYEFDHLSAGSYTVVASARDLTNSVTSRSVVSAGSVATVNFSMLLSSGAAIGTPTGLAATAFTYPDQAAATQAQTRAVQRWLTRVNAHRVTAASHHFTIQDWPAGSIIEADLTWTPPAANDLAGYVLDRSVNGAAFGTIDRFADPTASAYDDLDPLYTPDQSYQFRISAVSSTAVQSAPSNSAAIQPLAPLVGLQPAAGAAVTGTPTFTWQPVSRAQQYQVLVLSRPPDVSDPSQMPLVWPPAGNLAAARTAATQLLYAGPALQSGATYTWLVFAADQADFTTATAVSASQMQTFTVR